MSTECEIQIHNIIYKTTDWPLITYGTEPWADITRSLAVVNARCINLGTRDTWKKQTYEFIWRPAAHLWFQLQDPEFSKTTFQVKSSILNVTSNTSVLNHFHSSNQIKLCLDLLKYVKNVYIPFTKSRKTNSKMNI